MEINSIQILSKFPFIFISLGLIFLCYFFIQRKRDFVYKQNTLCELLILLFKIKYLKFIKNYIENNLIIFDKNKRQKISTFLSLLFIIYLIILTIYLLYTQIWYIAILGIIIISPLPILVFNLIVMKSRIKVIKQLPEALDELSLAFNNQPTLLENLAICSQSVPREIGNEFKRLSEILRTSNPKKSITEFIQRNDSDYTKILGIIFLYYIQKGGNINEQLDYLNDNISYHLLFKTKIQKTMLFPKIILIIMLGAMFYLINMLEKMLPAIKIIFATDPIASILLALFIFSIVIGLLILNIIQRT